MTEVKLIENMESHNAIFEIFVIFVRLVQILYWYFEAAFRFFVPPAMKPIDGEVILVTGAAGGIGKEICRHILKSGSNIKLVLWDLNVNELHKLAEELKSVRRKDVTVFCYEIDISNKQNIEKCCMEVKNDVGPVTIIFNNAGIAPTSKFLDLTDKQIEMTFQVNLMSQLWIIRKLLPDMIAMNYGRIVNICSAGALVPGHNVVPYISSKYAINGFTEALKAELNDLKCDGVHCTTVYPYFTKTPMTNYIAAIQNSRKMLPGPKEFLEPVDVAQKIIDGMRREYEYVYLPPNIPFVVFILNLMPNKLRKLLRTMHIRCFTVNDLRERRRFSVLLVSPGET